MRFVFRKKIKTLVLWGEILAMFVMLMRCQPSFALPYGAVIQQGEGDIIYHGHEVTIHQFSERLLIDWQGFSLRQGESIHFVQPSSHALIVNRVQDKSTSVLEGYLQADGRVMLLNNTGIMATATSETHVDSLMLAGASPVFETGSPTVFLGQASSYVDVAGSIETPPSGQVVLAGSFVTHTGKTTVETSIAQLASEKKMALVIGQTGEFIYYVSLLEDASFLNNEGVVILAGNPPWGSEPKVDWLENQDAPFANESGFDVNGRNEAGEMITFADVVFKNPDVVIDEAFYQPHSPKTVTLADYDNLSWQKRSLPVISVPSPSTPHIQQLALLSSNGEDYEACYYMQCNK